MNNKLINNKKIIILNYIFDPAPHKNEADPKHCKLACIITGGSTQIKMYYYRHGQLKLTCIITGGSTQINMYYYRQGQLKLTCIITGRVYSN